MSRLRIAFLFFVVVSLLVPPAAAHAQVMPDERTWRESLVHYQNGQELLQVERWERAAAEFREAIKLNRYFSDAFYGLGAAYMGMRRYTSAALAFQDCLESTRSIHSFGERHRVEFDRLIDELVREMSETVQRMGPTLRARQIEQRATDLRAMRPSLGANYVPPPRVLLALGSAHFRNGDRTRAEYYWREAVRIDDTLGEAWNNLAALCAADGRNDDARTAIAQAESAGFRVNPKLKEAVGK